MLNDHFDELHRTIDVSASPMSGFYWPNIAQGLRAIPNHKEHPTIMTLLGMVDEVLKYRPRNFTDPRSAWLEHQALDNKAARYYDGLFSNNAFIGTVTGRNASENAKAIMSPREFDRMLGWSLSIPNAQAFMDQVAWLLSDPDQIDVERKYLRRYDVGFQYAMGFLRTMTRHKPEWIENYPLRGRVSINEFFLRQLEEVSRERDEDTPSVRERMYDVKNYESVADFFEAQHIRYTHDPHRQFKYESLSLLNPHAIGNNSNIMIDLEFTHVQGAKEVRLYAGVKSDHFGAGVECKQYKINPELIGFLLREALAATLKVELFFEPVAGEFTEMTGNVLIADEGFTLSGFPKLI